VVIVVKTDVKQIDVHAESNTCNTVCVSSARNLIGYFNNVKVISKSSVCAIFKIIDKCAIVDAIQILLVKINECIYHLFFVECFM
jgi:hypothetical protein